MDNVRPTHLDFETLILDRADWGDNGCCTSAEHFEQLQSEGEQEVEEAEEVEKEILKSRVKSRRNANKRERDHAINNASARSSSALGYGATVAEVAVTTRASAAMIQQNSSRFHRTRGPNKTTRTHPALLRGANNLAHSETPLRNHEIHFPRFSNML